MDNKQCVLVLSDIRSCHNVGSLFRTSDGLGVSKLYLCGITPYPRTTNDSRPERVINSNSKQISKTALGAELSVPFRHFGDVLEAIAELRASGDSIYCLENRVGDVQDIQSIKHTRKFALVLGSETDGLPESVLGACDAVVEIPMQGTKNSFNVSVAGGIALWQLLHG